MEISKELEILITVVGGAATIIASFIAAITLLIWRKQQRYSSEFNAIMDLEDKYELLMNEYFHKYNWFFQRRKLAAESRDKSHEYKSAVNQQISNDYKEFREKDRLTLIEKDYHLAYIRAKRLFPSIDSYEAITPVALDDFFNKNLESSPEHFQSEESIKGEMMRYANNFHAFKSSGNQQFEAIRKSI